MPPMAVASNGKGRPRRTRRRLIVSAVGTLAVAAIALLFIFGPNKNAAPDIVSNVPADVPVTPVAAPISAEARKVAVRFVQTAVARKNLAEAWNLIGPNLKGGLTREEWLTGNNPVVPYPISELDIAPYKVDYSYKDSATLEVALLPKKGSKTKPQIFFLGLVKVGEGASAHWVVDNWVPRGSPLVPQG